MTTIGNLRHPITLERPLDISDGQGGYTRSWADYLNAWAEIAPVTGSIRMAAQKIETDVSHKVTIRYRGDVVLSTEMRVKYVVGETTRYFYVHGILNEGERNRYFILLCKEGVAR